VRERDLSIMQKDIKVPAKVRQKISWCHLFLFLIYGSHTCKHDSIKMDI